MRVRDLGSGQLALWFIRRFKDQGLVMKGYWFRYWGMGILSLTECAREETDILAAEL